MKQLSSHQFEDIYRDLEIDLDKLGCVMLKVDAKDIKKPKNEEMLYTSSNLKRFWIKGFVAEKTPHVTLLYGLLKPAEEYRKQIKEVLTGWKIKSVKIKEVGFFESQYEDDPYFCIIAHLDISPELLEGHERLQFLPHIDTFPGYKAHISICYIKKDEKFRDKLIAAYNKNLSGKEMKVTGFDLGGEKKGN